MKKLRAQKYSQLKIILWVSFLALSTIALLVVFFLPSQITTTPHKTEAVPNQEPPLQIASRAKALDKKLQEISKPKAEKLLSEALGQLARLESEGVRIWGIQTFKTNLSAAEDSLKKANALFDRQLYSHSLKHFQAAIYTFDQLRSSQGKRFEIAMENGLKAFEALDTKAAISQFKIAAALKPGDGNVTKSLDRARKLPTVLSNISQGKELESSNKLIKARDHYQAAVTLDAAYAPAKESLLRIKNKINERDYKQSISNAYSLFDRNNLKEASKELRRARKIRPNAPEIQDLAKKITSARQTANLTELQKQARAFEEQEKWSNALKVYQKAISIDKNAAFANRGRNRAQIFIELHKAIDNYTSQPSRLYSPEPLAHAKVLYGQSKSLDGSGRLLEDKRKKLHKLILSAETPIPVMLKSDKKTTITIYRVGRLDGFNTRRIELKPGSYTIVGSRPGYREVRKTLQVTPISKELVVTIQCKEPI